MCGTAHLLGTACPAPTPPPSPCTARPVKPLLRPPALLLPQTQLSCAAQHIFWSSIYGGVLGDDGRYDAYEMVMEILRVKLLYPDLDPKQYAEKDEDFRRFVHCEGGKGKRSVRRQLADGGQCPWHRHLYTPSLPRPLH